MGNVRRWRCALAATALALASATRAGASGGWVEYSCAPSHLLGEDPIVHPGMQNASHLHQFFANRTTNASSTYASMVRGASTCRASLGDTAGYWVPALYHNGVLIPPGGVSSTGRRGRIWIVYRRGSDLPAGVPVEAPPPDLRIIAGKSKAQSAAENFPLGRQIYWRCANTTTQSKTPPPACPNGLLALYVTFPRCWDGVVTGVDDTPHVVYPVRGTCPAGFSRTLPQITMRVEYPVGQQTGQITLSSGGSWTLHADFWNTWQQDKLEALVRDCLQAPNVDCGYR